MSTRLLMSTVSLACVGLLAACGSESSNTGQETSHPTFDRTLAKSASAYKPSGDIKDKTPTFTWAAINNATGYLLGHEDTAQTRWTEYNVTPAEANCVIGEICSYTPPNLELEVGDEKVWWIKAQTSTGWKNWSDAYVFNVISDSSPPTTSPKPISPKGLVTTNTPNFKWTPGNGASQYQVGVEDINASNWQQTIISASQANCNSTECSYTPTSFSFSNMGQKTWWVRAHNGQWGNWSKGSSFQIDINTPYIPFSSQNNVSNIIEINGYWYGLAGKELLLDDGANNVTSLYTAPVALVGKLSKSISGKLYFVATISNGSTSHNNSYGSGRKKSLISLTLSNNEINIVLSDTNVSIVTSMKNYLIISKFHKYSGRAPSITRHYKIDNNAKLITLGESNGRYTGFSIVSQNATDNTVLISTRRGGTRKKYIVTDKNDTGLEELTPFQDMPNVRDITLSTNGSWYAIDSTNTKIYESDGINTSKVAYTAPVDYIIQPTGTLVNSLNRGLLLFIIEKRTQNRLPNSSFITFNVSSKVANVISSYKDNVLRIKKGMGGYAYVTTKYLVYNPSPITPRYSPNHYKIDMNQKIISLGKGLSVETIDETTNEITFSKSVNGQVVRKKITKTINTGLEDI